MTENPSNRLSRGFFSRSTELVARGLLGATLCSRMGEQLTSGRIVEVEAYLAKEDSACHSVRGRTQSNNSMFERAGTSYVYPIHSRYCFNIATQNESEGTAVLIRAIQPLSGIDVMLGRRGIEKPLDLCRGPARLCEALGIDRQQDGIDLTTHSSLWLSGQKTNPYSNDKVVVTERIGVTSAEHFKLRFAVADCRYVSGPKRLRTR